MGGACEGRGGCGGLWAGPEVVGGFEGGAPLQRALRRVPGEPDRALSGLPRSPWKVTSINKSPQR